MLVRCPVDALLAEPNVEAVLNLTIPKAHFAVAMAALEAGKSVYNEKPLAVEREEARKILDFANEKALRVGCAPDTFSVRLCKRVGNSSIPGRSALLSARPRS